jgi:arylsulfatase A-like enzyme
MLGDHGLMAKMNFYRSSVRVPLIMRPPGGAANRAGHVEQTPVQAFDVAATLLDAGDADPLDEAAARSLLPFVTGDGGDPRTHAVSMIRMRPGAPTWHAITDGRWRLTVNADDGQPSELFDLASDPDEATNLYDHPGAAEQMKALTTVLAATVGSHDGEG